MSTLRDTAGVTPASRAARLERLKSLLLSDPQNERLDRECIGLALEAGDYQFVKERASATLATSGESVPALFNLATALIGLRDYAAAIEPLESVVSREPHLVPARINLGLCYYILQQYPSARAHLDAAYEAGDRSVDVLRLIVSTYHHLGLIAEAVAIADANPPPAQARAGLMGVYALLYIDADQPVPAARYASLALAANPDSIDGLVAQGTLDAARLRTERAREKFSRAAELAPGTGRAWIGLGSLSLLERNFERAREQIERGLDSMPSHTGSWLLLAWVHLFTGNLDAAEQTLRHTLDLDRNFAEAHGTLAAVLAMRGDREAAEREIEVAQRLDADGLSVQFARSMLVARTDSAAAIRMLQTSLAGLEADDGPVGTALKLAKRGSAPTSGPPNRNR
jgi:tetratricopeptide (TPR) repeat protein